MAQSKAELTDWPFSKLDCVFTTNSMGQSRFSPDDVILIFLNRRKPTHFGFDYHVIGDCILVTNE